MSNKISVTNKDLNNLINWLGIPKGVVRHYKFRKHKDFKGFGGSKISINKLFKNNEDKLDTIIHEFIHWYFWNTNHFLDLTNTWKKFNKGRLSKKKVIDTLLLQEQLTSLLSLTLLNEYLELNDFQCKEVKPASYLRSSYSKEFKFLYKYYFES
jgi:hypothetical protein